MMVKKLVVITGYSCAGKSTLIRTLFSPEAGDLREQLNVGDRESYFLTGARDLKKELNKVWADDTRQNMLVHYDLYGMYETDSGFSELKTLLNAASEITVISLCVNYSDLEKRVTHRVQGFLDSDRSKEFKRNKYLFHAQKLQLYQSPEFSRIYHQWFDLIDASAISHNFIAQPSTELRRWTILNYDRSKAMSMISDESRSETFDQLGNQPES